MQDPRPGALLSANANRRFLREFPVPAQLAARLGYITTLAEWPLDENVCGVTQVLVPGTGRAVVAYRVELQDMQPMTAMARDVVAYRFPLRMRPTTASARPDGEPPNTLHLPLLLMHCTNYTGLLGILQERCIPGALAGGEAGVGFWGNVNAAPPGLGIAGAVFRQAWSHRNNVCGVIFECRSEGPWERFASGSTMGERADGAEGASNGHRWRAAVIIQAMWLTDASLGGLADLENGM